MHIVKLFGYAASPFVAKTWCYLQYKDIDFTFIPVNPNPNDPDPVIEFTNQTQVPILQIDGEWRLESTQHAYWLDEVFPEHRSLCPAEHAGTVKQLDQWIDDFIISTNMRPLLDLDENNIPHEIRVGLWRMGMLAHASKPIPFKDLNDWPKLVVTKMDFIKHLAGRLDLSESTADMQERCFGELVTHLSTGPFLGGTDAPTLLDLSLFPNFVHWYLVGAQPEIAAARHPTVKAWLKRVAEYLPENPTPHHDEMLVHSLAEGLA